MYTTLHLVGAMFCPASDRIPWIPSGGIDVPNPWNSYTGPNSQCCDVTDPGNGFDAQGKESLPY